MPNRTPYQVVAVVAASWILAGCGKPAMNANSSSENTPEKPAQTAPAPAAPAGASKWSASDLAAMKEKYGELQESASGLLFKVIQPGDGTTRPNKGQRVSTHYTGTFPDGRVFDSSVSRGQPFQFIAGIKQVIPAWDETILEMTKGEKRLIVVPHFLGYGERGAGGVIPPRATLVFEMELLGMETPRLPGT